MGLQSTRGAQLLSGGVSGSVFCRIMKASIYVYVCMRPPSNPPNEGMEQRTLEITNGEGWEARGDSPIQADEAPDKL